jgi:hypothetical protein
LEKKAAVCFGRTPCKKKPQCVLVGLLEKKTEVFFGWVTYPKKAAVVVGLLAKKSTVLIGILTPKKQQFVLVGRLFWSGSLQKKQQVLIVGLLAKKNPALILIQRKPLFSPPIPSLSFLLSFPFPFMLDQLMFFFTFARPPYIYLLDRLTLFCNLCSTILHFFARDLTFFV